MAHINPSAKAALKGERGANGARGPAGGCRLGRAQGVTGAAGAQGRRRATRALTVRSGVRGRFRLTWRFSKDDRRLRTRAGYVDVATAPSPPWRARPARSQLVAGYRFTSRVLQRPQCGRSRRNRRHRLVPRPHGLGHERPRSRTTLDGWIVQFGGNAKRPTRLPRRSSVALYVPAASIPVNQTLAGRLTHGPAQHQLQSTEGRRQRRPSASGGDEALC